MAQADRATPASVDSIEDFVEGRPLCESLQFRSQVLLQRLPTLFSSPLERGVDVFREISYQNVHHACIMLSTERVGKRCSVVPRGRVHQPIADVETLLLFYRPERARRRPRPS